MDLTTAHDRISALSAPEDGPGFFRRNDRKAKNYACYWVNGDGQVALISKNYRTARSRNRMQQRLENGAYRAEPVRTEDRYAYRVVNGGNRLIAAGPLCATAAERDALLQSLPAALWPEAECPESPATPAETVAPPDAGQRHSFRLNFYRDEAGKEWQGRISYPLTESKQSFPGLDLDTIELFVRSVLEQQPAPSPTDREPVVEPPAAQPLDIVYEGRPLRGGALSVGETVNISLNLDQEPPDRDYTVRIYAKSLRSGERIPLDSQVVPTTAGHQPMEMPISTQPLTAGLYRVNAEVSPTDAPPASAGVWRASRLIQLI
jgi:hypothetical protein